MVAKGGKNWRRSVRQSVLNSGASTAASQKVQKITTRRRVGCGGSGGLINRVPQPHFNESLDLFDENDEEDLEEDNRCDIRPYFILLAFSKCKTKCLALSGTLS